MSVCLIFDVQCPSLFLVVLNIKTLFFKVPEIPKKVPEKKVPEKKVPEKKIPEKKVPVPKKEAVPPAKGILRKSFALLVLSWKASFSHFSYISNWCLFHFVIEKTNLLK